MNNSQHRDSSIQLILDRLNTIDLRLNINDAQHATLNTKLDTLTKYQIAYQHINEHFNDENDNGCGPYSVQIQTRSVNNRNNKRSSKNKNIRRLKNMNECIRKKKRTRVRHMKRKRNIHTQRRKR